MAYLGGPTGGYPVQCFGKCFIHPPGPMPVGALGIPWPYPTGAQSYPLVYMTGPLSGITIASSSCVCQSSVPHVPRCLRQIHSTGNHHNLDNSCSSCDNEYKHLPKEQQEQLKKVKKVMKKGHQRFY